MPERESAGERAREFILGARLHDVSVYGSSEHICVCLCVVCVIYMCLFVLCMCVCEDLLQREEGREQKGDSQESRAYSLTHTHSHTHTHII
jgi:cytochrome bd-type quinol oxidase subunit 1